MMRFTKSTFPNPGQAHIAYTNLCLYSVIALSKLFALNDARLAQVQVKGDLIDEDDGLIKTRSRARMSKFPYSALWVCVSAAR